MSTKLKIYLFKEAGKISFKKFSEGIRFLLKQKITIFYIIAYFVVFGVCNILEDPTLGSSDFKLAAITSMQILASIIILANMFFIGMWVTIFRKMLKKHRA